MNKLPQEIIDRIVFFLPQGWSGEYPNSKKKCVARYAVICSKFRVAIERFTFRRIEIQNEELETFAQTLTPGRRGFLRSLVYCITLPPIDPALSQRYERPAETEAVSKLFSLHIKNLFDALSRLDGMRGITLNLSNVWQFFEVDRDEEMLYGQDDFRDYRHIRSRIDLLASDALPQLTSISHLELSPWDRMPTPSILLDLAARMPGLQALDLAFISNEVRYPGLLRKDRCILATMLKLRSEETKKISVFTLDMGIEYDGNGAMHLLLPMPNVTYPLGYDPLGSSLRTWSQRLTEFHLKGIFDEALFWPHPLETTASPPQWLNLKNLYVHLERQTPSGWWYFMPKGKPEFGTPPRNPAKDPNDLPLPFTDNPIDGADAFDKRAEDAWDCTQDYGKPVEDCFTRNVPIEDTMQPLLKGWARALRSMRSLQRATLAFSVEIPDSKSSDEENVCWNDWEVIYESPESISDHCWNEQLEAEERSSRRLTFHNTRGWWPNKDTMDMLQRVGDDNYPGTKLVVLAVNEWDEVLR
ncbi:hypothetical protein V490_05473 [Pseudogymnoascus sp. VKM F-3557]|nr:hypothetical protein V490_05473 [Pseudogymnoascus sp. VKM F-3557]